MSVVEVPIPTDARLLKIGSILSISEDEGYSGFDVRVFDIEDAYNFLAMSVFGEVFECNLDMIMLATQTVPLEPI